MLKKKLISFEPTTFSQKVTLYLPKTNSHSYRFFFELDLTLNLLCFKKLLLSNFSKETHNGNYT